MMVAFKFIFTTSVMLSALGRRQRARTRTPRFQRARTRSPLHGAKTPKRLLLPSANLCRAERRSATEAVREDTPHQPQRDKLFCFNS